MRSLSFEEYKFILDEKYLHLAAVLPGLADFCFRRNPTKSTRAIESEAHLAYIRLERELLSAKDSETVVYHFPLFPNSIEFKPTDFVSYRTERGNIALYISHDARIRLSQYFNENRANDELSKLQAGSNLKSRVRKGAMQALDALTNRCIEEGLPVPVPVKDLIRLNTEYSTQAEFIAKQIESRIRSGIYNMVPLQEKDFVKVGNVVWVGGYSQAQLLRHFNEGQDPTPEQTQALLRRNMEIQGGIPRA